jgi:hypothetical protein
MMCGHTGCGCEVLEDQGYCSEACRRMTALGQTASPMDSEGSRCECGHAECQDAVVDYAEDLTVWA